MLSRINDAVSDDRTFNNALGDELETKLLYRTETLTRLV